MTQEEAVSSKPSRRVPCRAMRKQMFNQKTRGRGILNLIILDVYLAGLTLPVIIVALVAEVLRWLNA